MTISNQTEIFQITHQSTAMIKTNKTKTVGSKKMNKLLNNSISIFFILCYLSILVDNLTNNKFCSSKYKSPNSNNKLDTWNKTTQDHNLVFINKYKGLGIHQRVSPLLENPLNKWLYTYIKNNSKIKNEIFKQLHKPWDEVSTDHGIPLNDVNTDLGIKNPFNKWLYTNIKNNSKIKNGIPLDDVNTNLGRKNKTFKFKPSTRYLKLKQSRGNGTTFSKITSNKEKK